jgi:hypothetical protein|tara:strand:+ start:199 stop:330 length:132 start_codon:yes stop_codon:yes gene_type:complete
MLIVVILSPSARLRIDSAKNLIVTLRFFVAPLLRMTSYQTEAD